MGVKLISNLKRRGGNMRKFINKLDFDFYIKSPIIRPLSRFDKFYLMPKNDTM